MATKNIMKNLENMFVTSCAISITLRNFFLTSRGREGTEIERAIILSEFRRV